MARRLYNRGDVAWTTDVGQAVALDRLRDLRMVDRNTGISITDAQVNTPGTVGGLDWNPVTVTINSLIQIAEPLYLVNKHIILTDAGRLRANTGGYIQFFNCTIEVTSGGGAAHTAGQQPFNDGINANTGGHVAGQGSHFYGSTMFQNHPVPANLYLSMLDGMNSDFAFAPAANFVSVSLMPAARMINASIYGQAVNSGAITYYNAPAILEGVRIGGVAFEGNTGANSTNLILEPDFTDLTQVRKFFLQNNTSVHSLFQQAGFFSWPSNTIGDIIFTGGNTGQAYLAQNNSDRGGVIGYYGWKPEISLGIPTRDADGVLTNGVQGVNVRVGSGAILTATTAGTSAANNVGTRLNFGTAQDQTGNAINLETEYVTDTNGVTVIDSNTMVTSDGWDTEATGWVDWLKLGVENDTAQADNPGGNILGQNFISQNLPDNTAIVPLQVAQNRNVRQYPGRIQLRGYGVDVDFASTELGTVGTGAGQQTANSLVEIEDVEIITTSLSGVRVKASNVNADNTPNLSFDGSTPASLQDISNAVRSAWYQYEFDPNYTTDTSDNFPSSGPFNANVYPLNIVLSATAPTVAGNITFVENGYGIGLNSNVVEVAVHTNSLSALANDILNNNPSNVLSIVVGGRNIDGITYNGVTSGDFGTVEDSSITTTDTDNIAVASINNSTIGTQGQVTISTTTVESTVTSATSNVLFNGNINNDKANDVGGSATAETNVSALNNTINNYSFTATTGNVTLTGSTLDAVTVTAGDNINLTGATATGCTFTAADNINLSGTGVIDTTTLVGDNLNSSSLGRFGNGNTYGVLGRTLNINYPSIAAGTTTVEALLGANRTLLGTVNLVNDSGNEVIVEISNVADYAGIAGVSVTQGAADQVVGGFTYRFPAIPPDPRTFTIPSNLAGKYIIQTGNTLGAVQTKAAGSSLEIINTDDEQNVDYKVWWNPTSSWSGDAADAPVIYDYSYAAWNPSTMASSSSIADFQPDPSGAVTGAATETTAVTFTPVTGGTLSSGVAEFTITSAQTTYTATQAQTFAWQIQNSELYLLAIATADFNGTQRLIEFGSGDSTTYNSGGDLIRLNATGSQRILGASGGFLATALGPVMSVISADIILLSATLAQVAQASEVQINAVSNELKANQEKLSTDVRLASQLRPASGTIPNTSS